MKYLIYLYFLFFAVIAHSQILPGAYQIDQYKTKLLNKRVALVGNHTSTIGQVHLLDTLLKHGIHIVTIFGPEHGFRGHADAGAKIKNELDPQTGIKIISLYGKHNKPRPSEMEGLDILIFDIQDVGVRFFTYLSTLQFIMEACAETDKELIVLDRPNPNIACIDGPVLEMKYRSFVGLIPIPVVYGMTIGEYAQMINEEAWLKNGVKCKLRVIPCKNYNRQSIYEPPMRPSPNLPNLRAIKLYASLALFEGTIINVGRGTDFPFQVFGHPKMDSSNIKYTPVSKQGAMYPPHKDTLSYGIDLRSVPLSEIECFSLKYLMFAYKHMPDKTNFFNRFFYNLSGSSMLRNQIEQGLPEDEIKDSWKPEIENFKRIREKYLIYK